MPAFLDDVKSFLGKGIKNEDGLDLYEFLDVYDPGDFEHPSVTADILVFQYDKRMETVESGLKLLMIQRKNHPSIGFWALPGGFVDMREDTKDAAKRELYEETGLEGLEVTQLYCWGNYDRDPRTRIITVSYLAMIEEGMEVKAGDDAADALWFDVSLKQGEKPSADESICDRQYQIELFNKEKNIRVSAEVKKEVDEMNRFSEPNYTVVSSDGIAFDHPCFILQALDQIKSCYFIR